VNAGLDRREKPLFFKRFFCVAESPPLPGWLTD
jgi:hypothetical protein